MAEKETRNSPKDLIEATPEEIEKMKVESEIDLIVDRKKEMERVSREDRLARWVPKTQIGRDVKTGKETSIDNILEKRNKILESEIVDSLLKLESDLIEIGQAKGKFG